MTLRSFIPRATILRVLLLAGAIMLGGCGRIYHLPGHTEANLNQPPDITLRQGDRVRAISTGIVLLPLVPAFMESSNPGVVEVDVPTANNWGSAYLIAKALGTATVKYGWVPDDDAPNRGFVVTVVPRE